MEKQLETDRQTETDTQRDRERENLSTQTHLIRTPVPDGRDGETEHDARPRETTIVSRADEVPGVRWRHATLLVGVVVVVPVLDGRVGVGLEELLLQGFVSAHLDETCGTVLRNVT